MPNPLNPTVEIELGGETRNLKLDFGGLAAAESVTGRSFLSVRSLARLKAGEVAALVWGCLKHEEADLTLEAVQAWLHYGNADYVMDRLSAAVNACFPKPESDEDEADGDAPLDPAPTPISKPSRRSAATTSG